jgi:hypothetical protein
MPTPVTDPLPGDDIDAGEDHLAAARAAFAAPDDAPAEQAPAPAPAPKTPEAKKPGVLDSVVKLPGAKPADAPAPAPDAPPEDISKGLVEPRPDSKAYAGWQEFKKRGNDAVARATAAEKRAAEAEAKLKAATPTADAATTARLKELEQLNEQFSARLRVLDLKSHPEFEQKFVAPRNAAKSELEGIVKGDESDVKVDEILGLKGKAFNRAVSDALESLTPYARVKFQAALDRYIAADLGAEEALAKADEFLKTAKQTGGARSRETFDKVGSEYVGLYAPAQVDDKADDAAKQDADAYNTALAGVAKTAEKYAFEQLDEKTAAGIAHKAALYEFTVNHGLPRIGAMFERELTARDSKIASLEQEVKRLSAASPGIEPGSGPGAPAAGEPEDDHLAAARKIDWRAPHA